MAVTLEELRERQAMPLRDKIRLTEIMAEGWYTHFGGKVYVAFSGGKDSTVLLHIVRSMYPEVPAVFYDTGLEFPEIKEFVRKHKNVTCLKPKMTFVQVLEKYGYPVISKDQACAISRYRNTKDPMQKHYRLHGFPNGKRGSISQRWQFAINAPFKISDACCRIMKEQPAITFGRKNNIYPLTGETSSEGDRRMRNYMKRGCNAFSLKHPRSTPMGFWSENDVWEYIKKYKIPYSKIYNMGYRRVGCYLCGFGVHMEEKETGTNRFKLLQKTHPKLWKYCMYKLGMAEVLDYIGVSYRYRGERAEQLVLPGVNCEARQQRN